MAETNKPNIIINEDLDLLSTNILNLTLETNKQSFFKVDNQNTKINNFNNILNKRNKRPIENMDYNYKKYKLCF
jgi:hypothetical protein